MDQGDEAVVPVLGTVEIDEMFRRLKDIKGGAPLPDAEPSVDQLSALKVRVISQLDTPYADFALFTPFNARFQKSSKVKNFVFQPDGSFKMMEVAGLPNWDTWHAGWRVYANTLLMMAGADPLGTDVAVVSLAFLEEYLENFRSLVMSFPEAWYLCVMAEDRCRAKHFARITRLRQAEHVQGRAPDFNPAAPWDDVFREATRDWDKHVRDPALIFIAKHGLKRPIPTAAATKLAGGPAGNVVLGDDREPRTKRRRKSRGQSGGGNVRGSNHGSIGGGRECSARCSQEAGGESRNQSEGEKATTLVRMEPEGLSPTERGKPFSSSSTLVLAQPPAQMGELIAVSCVWSSIVKRIALQLGVTCD